MTLTAGDIADRYLDKQPIGPHDAGWSIEDRTRGYSVPVDFPFDPDRVPLALEEVAEAERTCHTAIDALNRKAKNEARGLLASEQRTHDRHQTELRRLNKLARDLRGCELPGAPLHR